MGEEAQRGLVLLYIAVFCVLEAEMLRRQTRLGRAMAASRWAMAAMFGLAAARRLWPGIEDWDTVQSLSRLAVAATLTWAVWELLRARLGGHAGDG